MHTNIKLFQCIVTNNWEPWWVALTLKCCSLCQSPRFDSHMCMRAAHFCCDVAGIMLKQCKTILTDNWKWHHPYFIISQTIFWHVLCVMDELSWCLHLRSGNPCFSTFYPPKKSIETTENNPWATRNNGLYVLRELISRGTHQGSEPNYSPWTDDLYVPISYRLFLWVKPLKGFWN